MPESAESPTPPPWIWPRSAYVHVPFCAHHCGYCDFAVAVGQDDRIDEYLRALELELSQIERPQTVDTLFFGGGTPTYLNVRQLETLLRVARKWLVLEPGFELSVEANPAGLDADKIRVLADHGVNRISLGSQSFDAATLRVLERDHRPEDVARAVALIRRRIDRVSLDLIFGVPGQELPGWQRDLEQALALEPQHVSTYGLTYEKGTRLWKQRRRGAIHPLDEVTELAMYTYAIDRLEAAGFEHYEISNHARPGFRCRHNERYWANEAHFGFGVGAASYIRGVRRLNTRDLHTYMRRAFAGEPTHFQSETLGPRERAAETAVVQLRRAAGIEHAAFLEQTGFTLDETIGPALSHLRTLGMLADDGQHIVLTRQGQYVADAVIQEVMKAAKSDEEGSSSPREVPGHA